MIAVLDTSLWLCICRMCAADGFNCSSQILGSTILDNVPTFVSKCSGGQPLSRDSASSKLTTPKSPQPCLKKGALKPSLQTCVSFSAYSNPQWWP